MFPDTNSFQTIYIPKTNIVYYNLHSQKEFEHNMMLLYLERSCVS